MIKEENEFQSRLIHKSFPQKDAYNALSMPVYHTSAFEFDSAEQMELAFLGKVQDHTYSRISNPTVEYFELKVKEITQSYSVTALNSGMAAISNVFLTIAKSGSNIVTSRHLFGNTYSLFVSTLADFGVETRFCDLNDLEQVKHNIDENTCAVFLEIITNPQLEIVDLTKLSSLTQECKVPLIADTTIVPFCAFSAGCFGVDIEVVSSTKYISGGATSLGGLIIDYATYDWNNSPRLKKAAQDFGKAAFTAKLRKEIHRNIGAYMTPHAAYMQTLGLDTLQLRYEKAANTCLKLASALSSIPAIQRVNYPGLESNEYYAISKKQFGLYPGAMLTFDLGSKEKAFQFLNNLKLIRRATNLFDFKTLAIHPASTIYGNYSLEVRKEMNVSDCTIRLAIGLENLNDLYEDIHQALS